MTIVKFILISILRIYIRTLRLKLALMKRNFRFTLFKKWYRLNLFRKNNWLYLLMINYWLSIRNLLNWNLLNWNLLKLNRIRLLMICWKNLRIINWSNIPIWLLICLFIRRRLSSLARSSCNTNYLKLITNCWLLLTRSDDTEV